MTKAERDKNMKLCFNSIKAAFDEGRDIDLEKLICAVMFKTYSSRRTSSEYIKAALSQFDAEEYKINNKIFIRRKSLNTHSSLI